MSGSCVRGREGGVGYWQSMCEEAAAGGGGGKFSVGALQIMTMQGGWSVGDCCKPNSLWAPTSGYDPLLLGAAGRLVEQWGARVGEVDGRIGQTGGRVDRLEQAGDNPALGVARCSGWAANLGAACDSTGAQCDDMGCIVAAQCGDLGTQCCSLGTNYGSLGPQFSHLGARCSDPGAGLDNLGSRSSKLNDLGRRSAAAGAQFELCSCPVSALPERPHVSSSHSAALELSRRLLSWPSSQQEPAHCDTGRASLGYHASPPQHPALAEPSFHPNPPHTAAIQHVTAHQADDHAAHHPLIKSEAAEEDRKTQLEDARPKRTRALSHEDQAFKNPIVKVKDEVVDTTSPKKQKSVISPKKVVEVKRDVVPFTKANCKTIKSTKQIDEAPKSEFIHVRARRGQATDSHSLAERVRREKISERMRFLQDLVPGCNKIIGKAMMLDEIINYVQSLQHQVEFLARKLALLNPRLDFNFDSFMERETIFAMDDFKGDVTDMPSSLGDPQLLDFQMQMQSMSTSYLRSSDEVDYDLSIRSDVSTDNCSG